MTVEFGYNQFGGEVCFGGPTVNCHSFGYNGRSDGKYTWGEENLLDSLNSQLTDSTGSALTAKVKIKVN